MQWVFLNPNTLCGLPTLNQDVSSQVIPNNPCAPMWVPFLPPGEPEPCFLKNESCPPRTVSAVNTPNYALALSTAHTWLGAQQQQQAHAAALLSSVTPKAHLSKPVIGSSIPGVGMNPMTTFASNSLGAPAGPVAPKDMRNWSAAGQSTADEEKNNLSRKDLACCAIPTCKHNMWTRLESSRRLKTKRPVTLNCMVPGCGKLWKTKLHLQVKCQDFFNGECTLGSLCPHPHIYARQRLGSRTASGSGSGSEIQNTSSRASLLNNYNDNESLPSLSTADMVDLDDLPQLEDYDGF